MLAPSSQLPVQTSAEPAAPAGRICPARPAVSQLLNNPPPRDVPGQFDPHAIPDQDPHEIALNPIRDMRRHLLAAVELHAIEPAWELFGDAARQVRTRTGTSLAVRIHGSPAVTATVCSKCAARLPSFVTAVQPSASTLTAALPALTIGSIASTMP